MEHFSTQWFTAYYIALGTLLVTFGIYLLVRIHTIQHYLIEVAGHEAPPRSWRIVLRYMLFFTLPCLILSFFPFSWVELLFSLWCLFIIYMAGQLLVLWNESSAYILKNTDTLKKKIRLAAANMISIGMILFLLCYVLIQRAQAY